MNMIDCQGCPLDWLGSGIVFALWQQQNTNINKSGINK